MRFQLLPPLSEDDREALKADIAARGVQVAVEYDQDGEIIDGHHRVAICQELGITVFPKSVRVYADDTARRMQARRLNIARRHLNSEARRVLIRDELFENADRSDREIARGLGVSDHTVAEVRAELVAGAQIAHQQTRKDAKGVAQPAAKPPQYFRVELPGADGEAALVNSAKDAKRARRHRRKRELERKAKQAAAANAAMSGERYDLRVCACSDWPSFKFKVDAIITDPPYPVEFLDCYSELSLMASKVLNRGGHCLVMCGQSHLEDVLHRLSSHLVYQWTFAYLTPGQSTQVFGRRIKSNWKPIVWLTNGKHEWEHVRDVFASDMNDKRFHEWGQSVGGMAQIVERFTVAEQIVLDPFCGAGTTGLAALALDRLFVGGDIDKERIAIAAERFHDQATQRQRDSDTVQSVA
jgi:ParB-like chromosome segregation protein Spo0J